MMIVRVCVAVIVIVMMIVPVMMIVRVTMLMMMSVAQCAYALRHHPISRVQL